MYAERTPPGSPPCESCRVELVSENRDAARIYMVVRGQTKNRLYAQTGPGGAVIRDLPVDIDHSAVWSAIDAYRVKDRVGCFEKVCRLFHAVLKEQRENEG